MNVKGLISGRAQIVFKSGHLQCMTVKKALYNYPTVIMENLGHFYTEKPIVTLNVIGKWNYFKTTGKKSSFHVFGRIFFLYFLIFLNESGMEKAGCVNYINN